MPCAMLCLPPCVPAGDRGCVFALSALLEPGEAGPLALAVTLPGLDEVPECPVKIPERFLVGTFGVLAPPRQRRVSLLLSVPQLVQVNARVPRALSLVTLLAFREAPVPREPGRPGVGAEHALLCRGGLQGEPVRLDDPHPATEPVHTPTMTGTSDI